MDLRCFKSQGWTVDRDGNDIPRDTFTVYNGAQEICSGERSGTRESVVWASSGGAGGEALDLQIAALTLLRDSMRS